MSKSNFTRRGILKTSAIAGAGLAMPTIFTSRANAFTNEPTGSTVTLGFNVPLSGPYADEGADELRALELAVEHLNGGGDGGMMSTFSSKTLDGTGILGKQVEYVSGDDQTKADVARATARSMIEKDGAVMITGGSSSATAVAVQALCQGSRHHLHERSDPCQRHHREGPEGQRLPSLLQLLHVRRGARADPRLAIRHRPEGLPSDGGLQLGLHDRNRRSGNRPRPWAGRRWIPCSRR